jgi:predicted Fe-S protein YdhL (DUF1289 family)
MAEVFSPCVRNCCLNDEDNCLGCFRSVDEIMEWHVATEQRKQQIIELAETRKTDYRRKYGLNQPGRSPPISR